MLARLPFALLLLRHAFAAVVSACPFAYATDASELPERSLEVAREPFALAMPHDACENIMLPWNPNFHPSLESVLKTYCRTWHTKLKINYNTKIVLGC